MCNVQCMVILYSKKIRSGNVRHSSLLYFLLDLLIFERSKIFIAVKEGFKIIYVVIADRFGGSDLYIRAETAEP